MCHQEARLASYDIEALLSSHFPSQYLRNPYISATLIRNSYVINMLLLCDVCVLIYAFCNMLYPN